MTGVLIVAHGDLGGQLIASVGMIMGRLPLLSAVGLSSDQSLEDLAKAVQHAWSKLEEDGADEILILVDMFGGSCSNVAGRLVRDRDPSRVALLTGVNLPMVLEAVIDRDLYPFMELVPKIAEAGRKSIVDVRAALAEKLH
jgi:mannose/fructose/sorbose-specific phosphotransferase system IIA component